jgi:transcriptional regulator with XRE-family HTH domain
VQIGAIREFGARVRQRRQAAGLSQAALAASADLDRLYLGRLERGGQNPTLLVMSRLAVELGVTLEEMLAGIEIDPDEVRSVARLSRGPRRFPLDGNS